MGPKFSIRYKFLAVTTVLLAVCVGTYLLLASFIFKEDKRALVFDYNRSLVVNLSSDLENFVRGVSDKMELVAHFHRKRDKSNLQFVQNILANDYDLVWVGSSLCSKSKPEKSRSKLRELSGREPFDPTVEARST